MPKRTPLYNSHIKLNAKMVEFGGWEMPVQYTSIIEEHEAVRTTAGLFDVSHMGEVQVKGSGAAEKLNRVITNDVRNLITGKILYSPMCRPSGGIVDDVLVYCLDADDYLIIVNAANTEKSFDWIRDNIVSPESSVEVINISESYAQIALQGVNSQNILSKLTDYDLNNIKFYMFANILVNNKKAIVSRTGYTGEDGFEIYISPDEAENVWEAILGSGEKYGIKPAGLGARDTLRFEAALPLYGHELSEAITPVEARLKTFVKTDKTDFIGKEILSAQIMDGAKRTIVGLELTERGIPRDGYKVFKYDEEIGYITSGTHSPTLKKGLGMALIDKRFAITDSTVEILIRDKKCAAKIINLPFYKKRYKH